MNERISLADKKPKITSRNPVPQIRRKTESSQSMNSPIDRIMFLQRTIGNQVVGNLMKSGALQAKLRIGQPGDVYEQEADRVAEQVMRMPDVSSSKETRIQRKCPKCLNGLRGLLGKDKKDEGLQAKEIRGETPEVTSNMETNINALRGGGQPLSESTRAFFEPRFGTDFSRVRVHSGGAAEQSARDVNALAYTVGRDIVFGAGRFAPGTHEGRRLIAHELTHVVHQSGADGIHAGQSYENHVSSPISPIGLSIQRQSDHPEEQDAEDAIRDETTPCSEIIRHIENLIEALAGRFFDINKPENKGGDAGHRERIINVQKILRTLITLAKLKCKNGEYDEALDEEAQKWRDKKFSQQDAETKARRVIPDWVWAVVGAVVAVAIIACFASGVCTFGAVVAGLSYGTALLIMVLLRQAGIKDSGSGPTAALEAQTESSEGMA